MTAKPNLILLSGLLDQPSPDPSLPVDMTRGPRAEVFRDGTVLAFDQSLNATGYVLLRCDRGHLCIEQASQIPMPEISAKGHEANLLKGVALWQRMCAVLTATASGYPGAEIAHETPPVGGRMARPESSLLSALSLRIAAATFGWEVTMVGAQKAKRWIAGNANADKKTAHAALAQHFGDLPGYEYITNEAKCDALMIALTILKES